MNIEINLCLPVGILCRIPHSMPAGFYISVSAKDKETAEKIEEAIVKSAEEKIKAQTV